MNTQLKNILVGVACVIVGIVVGYFMFHREYLAGAISPTGTYQSGVRADYESISVATAATTTGSFAILNSSNDRVVESGFAYCTGITGNSAFSVTAATSSVSTTTSTSYAMNLTIATTTAGGNTYVSSSTSGTSGVGVNAIQYTWPANTYLVFSFNATNTAVCTVGVKDTQL